MAIRNLFAFLTGQPLIGTKANPTTFHAFLRISSLLQEYGFSSADGTSFGEAVDLSFGFYISQLALADVRHSREKTLEALILGEHMHSTELYNEAFAHAVGKYSAIMDIKSPLFEKVSVYTRERLERAHLGLVRRLDNVNTRLERFEFPSLFSGTANSTSNAEHRPLRFKVWMRSFERMRSFVLGYYKSNFGNWPPKARSKKNPFSESGLNRLVLKALYSDLCALYDLLVDREAITTRGLGQDPDDATTNVTPMMSALRGILAEFDHSSPPVLPPIPFDVPLVPNMDTIIPNYHQLSAKEQAKADRKMSSNEHTQVLLKSYNEDMRGRDVPFLREFKEFERKENKGRTAADMADQRVGHWLFLYVVIQSLPILVVDAPGLKFTEGVEYFLCQPPMGNPPWVEDGNQVRKMWYEVSGGAGYVELSADAVMFSVEAIYHRSHCWLAAKKWEGIHGAEAPPPDDASMSPLEPPRAVFQSPEMLVKSPTGFSGGVPSPLGSPQTPVDSPNPRGRVPGRGNPAYRSSMALGIEPVPGGIGAYPGDRSSRVVSGPRSSSLGPRPPSAAMGRSVSTGNLHALARDSRDSGGSGTESPPPQGDPQATFDSILAGTHLLKTKKKSRFF